MSEIDFRKAYAAEVKASAESKKRCNDLIEWTELQRQTAISSHAGQLRNTIAFKAERDLLAKVLAAILETDSHGYAVAPMSAALRKQAQDALDAVGALQQRGADGDK